MTCPVCGGKTKVIDSRAEIDSVCRCRECVECGHYFYTEETESDYAREGIRKYYREQQRNCRARKKGVNV